MKSSSPVTLTLPVNTGWVVSTVMPSEVTSVFRPTASTAFTVTKYFALFVNANPLCVMFVAFPADVQGTIMFPLLSSILYLYSTIPLPLFPSAKPFQFAAIMVSSDWKSTSLKCPSLTVPACGASWSISTQSDLI